MAEAVNRGVPELETLYRDVILEHFRNPRGRKALAAPTCRNEGFNPVCGDQVRLALKIESGKVAGVEVDGRGCAISVASGSMMSELLAGKTEGEARRLVEVFKGMMHGQGIPAGADVGDLDALEGVKKFPVRIKCALLAWTTLEDALKALEAGRAQPESKSTTEEGERPGVYM
jgi:nitrogen fixation NifU-like protein